MNRYLINDIIRDLPKKMVIITGPRQIGKTYLAKSLLNSFQRPQYLNYDAIEDANIILNQSWHKKTDLLVLDEIHKMKNWKKFLKGVFDTKPVGQSILITGSARLDTFRQSGESLAGRYFHYRLDPLSVKELNDLKGSPSEPWIEKLNRLGGFPEPFFSDSTSEASRWRNQYYTDLIREDIVEFSRIQEIRTMKILLELLRDKVGSSISYSSLARDLQLSPNSVKNYLDILSSLYIIFFIYPFHKNIARSILKEPKVYFYDTGLVKGDESKRLENTCAISLLKHTHYLLDSRGENVGLHYIRTKEGREVDFALSRDGELTSLLEVKLSDDTISPHLYYFSKQFKDIHAVQMVFNLKHEQTREGISVELAENFLARLSA